MKLPYFRRDIWLRIVVAALMLVPTIVSLAGDSSSPQPSAKTAPAASAADAAAEKRLADATRYLASDELEGRGLGTKGIELAADYLGREFEKIGLKTALYDGQPYQKFPLTIGAKLGPADRNQVEFVGSSTAGGAAASIPLSLGVDFNPLAVGGSGKFDLPLVFAGYGITAKSEKYDDYAGIDVKDKAVVLLRHQPQRSNPHGLFGDRDTAHAFLNRKVSNAYEHGAAAVIFCTDGEEFRRVGAQAQEYWQAAVDELAKVNEAFGKIEHPTPEQIAEHKKQAAEWESQVRSRARKMKDADPLMEFDRGGDETEGREFPVLHCRRSAIDELLKAALKTDLETIEKQIDEGPTPHSHELTGWRIRGETNLVREQTTARNVIGVLEGTGPLADETIVVGAHYDHLGYGGVGSLDPGVHAIHHGADDNGSGDAALLEVARQLVARNKEKPLPRRVVFIAFTGEERGLLGSARYVKNPLFPLDKTVAMLNMDMVGRLKDDKLIVYGNDTATEFDPLLAKINEQFGFKLMKQPGGFGPSDHASFYPKQIPVLHFFTGSHKDYHRPTDTAEKLNVPGMRRVAALVGDVALALADAPARPHYTESKVSAAHMALGSPGDRPYFGSIPDFGQDQPGYAITGVSKGSPADRGGLKGGDIIIRLGDSKIGNLEDFDSALRKHKAGEKVPVVVKRGSEEMKLEVTLDPPR